LRGEEARPQRAARPARDANSMCDIATLTTMTRTRPSRKEFMATIACHTEQAIVLAALTLSPLNTLRSVRQPSKEGDLLLGRLLFPSLLTFAVSNRSDHAASLRASSARDATVSVDKRVRQAYRSCHSSERRRNDRRRIRFAVSFGAVSGHPANPVC